MLDKQTKFEKEKFMDSKKKLSGMAYVEDLCNVPNSIAGWAWIEGWICGYTDPMHELANDESLREDLMEILLTYRRRRELDETKAT